MNYSAIARVFLASITILTCAHFGAGGSGSGNEKPPVNFYGKLVDGQGSSYTVENITINGAYKNIPFYKKPPTPEGEPTSNKTLIDLSEIAELAPRFKDNPLQGLVTLKNRKFIEVVVTFKDATSGEDFIIEHNRTIFCDIKSGEVSIEKQLTFEAIKSLTISGYRAGDHTRVSPDKKRKKDRCKEAREHLERLEKTAKNVAEPALSELEKTIALVKTTVQDVCD